MIDFNRDYIDMFLGVVRKYMQVRGVTSQKDLSELTGIGVSSLSRFLNQKTKELDAQMIGNIVAKLNIPLHEIIDFIAEGDENTFKRIVKFYKDEAPSDNEEESIATQAKVGSNEFSDNRPGSDEFSDMIGEALGGTAERRVNAKVRIGDRVRNVPFQRDKSQASLREKLENLSPRQKAYLADFLSLDIEGRDLVVDLGNSLFRYFRQKGMEL
ncbi:MAG: helix-turn-helix domain-containing protein [Bacteriovoracia bacterium]